MPRSECGRVRGNCTDATPGHARGQAPVAGRAPGAVERSCRRPESLALVERLRRRAAHRAGASRRTGLSLSGDRWRVGRAVDGRQRGSEDRGEGNGRATRPSWKTIGAGPAARLGAGAARAGRTRRPGLMEAAGLGLAGCRDSLEQAKGNPGAPQGLLATGMGEGGEMSGLKRAFMGLARLLGILTDILRKALPRMHALPPITS
jgi:hypothetical protein